MEINRFLIRNDKLFPEKNKISSDISKKIINKITEKRSAVIVEHNELQFIGEPFGNHGTVYLFGEGHVSKIICEFTKKVDFRVIVLDDREAFCNSTLFERADKLIVLKDFKHAFNEINIENDSYLSIINRGHSHDEIILSHSLKSDAKYIGMIGSRRKRDIIYNNLLNNGFEKKDSERVFSPVGLDIGAESPEEIAISIMGELIRGRSSCLKKNRIF